MLIESSDIANAKMRIFNRDGSEGKMAGNCIRCAAKYLYDKGYVDTDTLTVETAVGVKDVRVYTSDGKVTLATVDMGEVSLAAAGLPAKTDRETLLNYPLTVGGKEYTVNCVSVGNPHCVVFCDSVDRVDIEAVGPLFENHELFPERINTEFVRVVNSNMLKMRVYERGNGETSACGSGACAAVVAACENGYCNKGEDITVKVRGGDLTVNYDGKRVTLTGEAKLAFTGRTSF